MHAACRAIVRPPLFLASTLIGSACFLFGAVSHEAFAQSSTDFAPPTGDPAIVSADARLELLFDDACFTEGVTVAPDGQVYFSDITFTSGCRHGDSDLPQAGIIWRYDPAARQATVFRSPSGMANGLKFDAAGNLIVAEGADFGGRQVTITDMTTGRSRILAALYDGQPFNAPNDVAVDLNGRIYFTDPRYLGHEPVLQPTMAVYRADPDGSVTRIISDAGKPNGLLVSPDQTRLYVVSNDNGALDFTRLGDTEATQRGPMIIWVYDLGQDGSASNRRQFVDYAPYDSAGGLAADVDGNVYAAVRRADAPGIYVYNTAGKELASIPTGDILPSNLAFGRGADSNLLYVTAGNALYQIRMNSQGYQLPDR
ncbi:MAG: SMP-30/gluconolactonase/LRE family protein [Alphaproteobacteria bacterium]